ncbi:hypothetical protein [uncultured Holdemanella sp.]|uniref:hypothetical protein n=1 Tax=uncultured Holdemanella sp. TaxID=1763549 RepID=UPI0025FE4F7F|nr:hypothetical protein [uncultured Holdemanella sp.]
MYKLELKLLKEESKIAILCFDENNQTIKYKFRCLDAVPHVMEGTLIEKLDELFGGNK